MVIPTNIAVNNVGKQGSTAFGASNNATKVLINGEKFTTEHRNMWICSLPPPQAAPVEIVIFYAL